MFYQFSSTFRNSSDTLGRMKNIEGDGELVRGADFVPGRAVISSAVPDSNRIED